MNPIYPMLLSFVPLGVMIRSDFAYRRIAVLWLLLFGVLQFISWFCRLGFPGVFSNLAANIVFLALLYGSLWLYIGVLRRKRFSSLWQAVGAGDLLFLPLLAPGFGLHGFVLFLLVSFVATLAGWGLCAVFSHKYTTIPLAGSVGICFLIYSVINTVL